MLRFLSAILSFGLVLGIWTYLAARPHAEDLWVQFNPQPDISTPELAKIIARVTPAMVINPQVWAEMPPELKRHFAVLPNPMSLPNGSYTPNR